MSDYVRKKARNIVDHIFLYGLNENNTFYNMALTSALEMAEWKDSQPQIVEILGKRVKVVEDESHTTAVCHDCAFYYFCKYTLGRTGELCESASHGIDRHFVEVDEDGNEIKKEQKQTI